ncbi:ClbS/DfsB family four-helix bundle protein [Lactococcus garvieae]|uniref:ClbS/DfsB family four-helix bundle protein n=1 Tax=Lactococcus garvieae TaxID=1363 RepID=UPI0009BD01A4|nr:ClbS/DfsB family four-helix bundle protein [Lactococcus garvieae]
MVKAKTKEELIQYSEENWRKICRLVEDLPPEVQQGNFNFGQEHGKEAHWGRDKNIRDVLAHLYEWQKLLQSFVLNNQKGKNQSFLPVPYTWKSYAEMNQDFWKKHQESSYEEMKEKLAISHQKTLNLLQEFTNEELYTKKFYSWTGTTTLGQYFQSSLASHYDWALKKIRLHKKTF